MKFSDLPPGAGIMQHTMLQKRAKILSPKIVVRDSIPAGAPVNTAVACVTGSWVVTNHALLPGRNESGMRVVVSGASVAMDLFWPEDPGTDQ